MGHNTPALSFTLHDVARLLRKRFEQRARSLGLTRAQWQALMYLAQNEGIHQGGLAELLEIEPITLVRILDKLEARGLIERRRHATDRRTYGDATRGEALDGISDAEQQRLFETLSAMKGNLLKACSLPVEEREVTYG